MYWLVPPADAFPLLSFNPAAGMRDVEEYRAPPTNAPLSVTFDRATWDESEEDALVFMTYGAPELAALLPAVGIGDD